MNRLIGRFQGIFPKDKKVLFILSGMGLLFLLFEIITGLNYPIFRDEFYYLDCARHLALGYVDQPPLSIFILSIWTFIFGDSQLSIRILPALCGSLLILLGGKTAEEFGGSGYSQILTGIAIFITLAYNGILGFYSMNSFDILFWSISFLIIVKYLNTKNEKYLLILGIVFGFALMNKIGILFLMFAFVVGLLFTSNRKILFHKKFVLSYFIAFAIFLPYIVWNFANGWPTLEFMRNASLYKIASLSTLDFMKAQVLEINPSNLLIWVTGLFGLVFSKKLSKYRILGFIYIICLIAFLMQNSKPYYLFAAYTALLPAGAVIISSFLEKRNWKVLKYILPVSMIIPYIYTVPLAVPILPPDEFVDYSQKLGITTQAAENQEQGLMPQHFADRFGWQEMTEKVANIYNSLPPEEREVTGIFTMNYGEAGAINYYGRKYDLPTAYCGHNNHFLWGPPEKGFVNIIIIGGDDHEDSFEEVLKLDSTDSKFAMPYETNITIYLGKKLIKPLKEIWPGLKHYI
jgi:hypothetical protein